MNTNESKILGVTNSINKKLEKTLNVFCITSMAGLATVMILNVLFRYFISYSLVWADEVVLYLFSWTSFLGACLGVQKNNMAAVRMLVDRFSGNVLKVINIIIQFLIILFGILLTFYSYLWWSSASSMNTTSPTIGMPMWIPTIILPISMGIITIFALTNIIKLFFSNEIEVDGADEVNLKL